MSIEKRLEVLEASLLKGRGVGCFVVAFESGELYSAPIGRDEDGEPTFFPCGDYPRDLQCCASCRLVEEGRKALFTGKTIGKTYGEADVQLGERCRLLVIRNRDGSFRNAYCYERDLSLSEDLRECGDEVCRIRGCRVREDLTAVNDNAFGLGGGGGR